MLLNGEPLAEPYLKGGVLTEDFLEISIPEDHVFVMGDNRPNSRDSRSFGPIHEDLLVGEVFLRLWPFNALGRP